MRASSCTLFVERQVSYSTLFIYYFLVVWHTSAVVSLPPGDIILAQLACPLKDIIFCLHQEYLTYLSTSIVAVALVCSLGECQLSTMLLHQYMAK